MPSQIDLILRLLLAAGLAGALGIERELTEQPAGFRTHILVGLGAALFAIVSAYGFQAIVGHGPGAQAQVDVSRVASQIVVGIGFLGGGAILKYGASVRGLTTAASLWVTAAIGTAVGIGALLLGTVAAVLTIGALVGLRPLRSLLRRYAVPREEFIVQADPDVDVGAVMRSLRSAGAELREVRIVREPDGEELYLNLRLGHRVTPADVGAAIGALPHVRSVDWQR